MCEECDELRGAIEQKVRVAERAQALLDGFQPAPTATADELRHVASLRAASDRALLELQRARNKWSNHKAKHADCLLFCRLTKRDYARQFPSEGTGARLPMPAITTGITAGVTTAGLHHRRHHAWRHRRGHQTPAVQRADGWSVLVRDGFPR